MPRVSDYQPSAQNLRHYLRTEKYAREQPFPGLIGTHGYAVGLFFIAVAAEGWGLYALWGASQFNPMFAVFLFFLDLGAALLTHASARGICIQRNLRKVNDCIDPGGMQDLVIANQVSRFAKLLTWLGRFLIVGLAAGKCLAMQSVKDNFGDGALPVFLTVIACYLIAALVHLTFSGDALFEISRLLLLPKEILRYRRAVREGDRTVAGWPQNNVWQFHSQAPIKVPTFREPDPYTFPVEITRFGRYGYHSLVHIAEGQYELHTLSTLTDDDALDLYRKAYTNDARQLGDIRNLIRKECITMQFIIFLQLKDPRLIVDEDGKIHGEISPRY